MNTYCFLLLALLAAPLAARAQTSTTAETALRQRVTALLAAYGRQDVAGVLALAEPGVVMIGTDSAEVRVGRAAVARQLRDDFLLWLRMEFGAPEHLHLALDGRLASAFFDVPSTVAREGNRRDRYYLRFATTWRKAPDGQWYLVQSMNSVPTKGQSAGELAEKYGLRKGMRE